MLTRFLIRLRWPMAVLASIVLATAVVSGSHSLNGGYIFKVGGPDVLVNLHGGGLLLAYGHTGMSEPGDSYTGWWFQTSSPGPRWNWNQWRRCEMYRTAPGALRVMTPIWTIALVLSTVALAGFRARRAVPTLGQCLACRHQLHGASVCPECGRGAQPN
jgi:hypothetical protein